MNLADIFILVGTGLMAISALLGFRKHRKEKSLKLAKKRVKDWKDEEVFYQDGIPFVVYQRKEEPLERYKWWAVRLDTVQAVHGKSEEVVIRQMRIEIMRKG